MVLLDALWGAVWGRALELRRGARGGRWGWAR